MHKTTAWPLSQAYAVLIVYASLYPFTGWRDQGIAPWAFLESPFPPKYWTGFDLAANAVGYAPLGFLLALSFLRRAGPAFAAGRKSLAILIATLAAAVLSLAMEALQSYLPERVPSNLDFGLNAAGALAGAGAAVVLDKTGIVRRWSRYRLLWFVEEARGALVLLALWPVALLFPASVPLGLGQVLERLEAAVAEWLQDTPFLEWLPVREVELQPLVPAAELLCVALGVFIPCLLGYSVLRSVRQRAVFTLVMLVLGISATALSAALSWGPAHAWSWLSMPVRFGLLFGLLLSMLVLAVPRRGCAGLMLVALVTHLSVLNQAPASAYFTHTLQTWEQGRFIRFHGLVQWLGWLWPYAALVYVLLRLSRREAPPTIAE